MGCRCCADRESYLISRLGHNSEDRYGTRSGLLRQLGHSGEVDSRPVASAWIEHYYATPCAEALKRWKPVRGDVVTLEHDRLDVTTGELYRTTTDGAISSIGDNGLIYFRGGNGKGGWATHITRKQDSGERAGDDLPSPST